MNFKNEKGSITVYVLVGVFFLLAIIAGRFVIANRNLKVQYDALARVKAIYEKNDKQYGTNEVGSTEPDIPEPVGPIEHEIYIFNKDAFNFFNNPSNTNDKRFYVYQTDIWYIADSSASKEETKDREISLKDEENYTFKYKLMSDITVTTSTQYQDNSDAVIKSNVCKNLDFNNHIIHINETYDGLFIRTYYENYVFSDNGTPTRGKIKK